MTTNKPDVAAWQAINLELKKAVAALTDARFTRCDGPAGWRPPLGNHAGTLIDRIDSLEAECDHLRKDAERIDWLADPENSTGDVRLPTKVVTQNLHSLRDAIDAAMREAQA